MTSLPADGKVLGMEVNKLQSNVTVDSDNVFSGTLHFVADFESYDKGAKGNFLAAKIVAPSDAEVKITTGAAKDKPLDESREIVWKVASNEDTLKVTVEKNGEKAEKTYSAAGLTLEPGAD